MRHGGTFSSQTVGVIDCIFCQRSAIASYILKETPGFRIIADHAPLLEGHVLIIPKQHYACYGDTPAALDLELLRLKHEVREFFAQFYSSPVFWEHGVFRQTVFHAHLHCFPFGNRAYNPLEELHKCTISSQDDIRGWYRSHGHYFYLEDHCGAHIFAPVMDDYTRIIQKVLWPGVTAHVNHTSWRSAQQRQAEGKPLIESTMTKWHLFQRQGENNVDHANTR